MDINTIVLATKDQVSAELSGDVVILNLKTGIYFGLNPIGAYIWTLIQSPLSLGFIRDTIMKEYDVDTERCEYEVLDLAQKLADHGLIEVIYASNSQIP